MVIIIKISLHLYYMTPSCHYKTLTNSHRILIALSRKGKVSGD